MAENQKKEILLPKEAACECLWRKYQTPARVQAHCRAVCGQALLLGEKIQKNGYQMNLELIAAAALLHDIVRQEKDHAAKGADILMREGYPQVARLIACHHDFRESDWNMKFVREAAVLYLADKQIQGVTPVSVRERFEKSKERCGLQDDAGEALLIHQIRWEQAKAVEQYIESLLHVRGETYEAN